MPIPKPNIKAWGYEKLIPQYASSDEYYERVKPRRVKCLQQLMSEHSPKAIIGYGKIYWKDYKKIFSRDKLPLEKQYLVGKDKNKIVVLTDGFTAL
jgi:hypothetical protein